MKRVVNEHEIPHIREIASDLGVDILSFKTYNPALGLEGAAHEFLPKNENYRRFSYNASEKLIRNQQNPCTKLWNTISDCWNGSVVPCNCVHQDEFVLGILKERILSKVMK